jgi:hypothetical protein
LFHPEMPLIKQWINLQFQKKDPRKMAYIEEILI